MCVVQVMCVCVVQVVCVCGTGGVCVCGTGSVCVVQVVCVWYRWWPTTTATGSGTSLWRAGRSTGQATGRGLLRMNPSVALMAPSVRLMVSEQHSLGV